MLLITQFIPTVGELCAVVAVFELSGPVLCSVVPILSWVLIGEWDWIE